MQMKCIDALSFSIEINYVHFKKEVIQVHRADD